MTTRFWLLTSNARRETLTEDEGTIRDWDGRVKYYVEFLKKADPSVIGFQELAGTQNHDLIERMGPLWSNWGEPSNRQVWWRNDKWEAVDKRAQTFQSLTLQETTHVRLKRIETGDMIWVSAVHCVVGSQYNSYRVKEINAVIDYIKTLPGGNKSAIAGDFNSSGETTGVRQAAAKKGYKSVRAKTTNDMLTGETYNTTNGWGSTKKENRWIDDVLTPSGVKVYGGGVHLTCKRVYPRAGSDHNGVLAKLEF